MWQFIFRYSPVVLLFIYYFDVPSCHQCVRCWLALLGVPEPSSLCLSNEWSTCSCTVLFLYHLNVFHICIGCVIPLYRRWSRSRVSYNGLNNFRWFWIHFRDFGERMGLRITTDANGLGRMVAVEWDRVCLCVCAWARRFTVSVVWDDEKSFWNCRKGINKRSSKLNNPIWNWWNYKDRLPVPEPRAHG